MGSGTFQKFKYDGSTEKRIYPEHIAKVYPKLRGKMANLTSDEEGYVINELWSFIAATIEESPILQKAGWAVGTEPDGDNFAVYYETLPRGQSFEDIIEQDVILAVDEVESGSYALRHDEDGDDDDDREDNPSGGHSTGMMVGVGIGAFIVGSMVTAASYNSVVVGPLFRRIQDLEKKPPLP